LYIINIFEEILIEKSKKAAFNYLLNLRAITLFQVVQNLYFENFNNYSLVIIKILESEIINFNYEKVNKVLFLRIM
jgi:hypothetical protein